MWYRRRNFSGKGIFWLIVMIYLFGGMGKSGFPWFLILFFFWVIGPVIFAAFKSPHRRPTLTDSFRQPRTTAKRYPSGPSQRSRASQQVQSRSLAGVSATCRACGGPADKTTVEWRGNRPICGFCGTAL